MARKRKFKRVIQVVFVLFFLFFILLAILNHRLRSSLPQLDGALSVDGLHAPVSVDRDALGVPSIQATGMLDAQRALGFVHGQDRFFQMDMLRRIPAGEIAALLGEQGLRHDRGIRAFRLRNVASRAFAAADKETRAIIEAYTAGVNVGLASLNSKPWEYHLLRAEPQPWQGEDTLLAILAMALTLNDEKGTYDLDRAIVAKALPAAMGDFLSQRGSDWDAPLQGDAYPAVPMPDAQTFDVRTFVPQQRSSLEIGDPPPILGSNNWAVGGELTAYQAGMVANDMHLSLAIPHVWYRADLQWSTADGTPWRVSGVSLPGAPGIIAGSNGHIAWGFTNTYGDWVDVVELEMAGTDNYRTADGSQPLQRFEETIAVRGGEAVNITVEATHWGPVVGETPWGTPYVVIWTMLQPDGLNGHLLHMGEQTTAAAAMDLANRCGMPAQNLAVVDKQGAVGWTVAGKLPKRLADDGYLPRRSTEPDIGWDGWVDNVPRLLNPPSRRIWTANSRVGDLDQVNVLGWGGYALGARQAQIRDRLFEKEAFDEKAMLAIQLDNEARFLKRWRKVMLDALDDKAVANHPDRAAVRRLAENWSGRAALDDAGYTMVRSFHLVFQVYALDPFVSHCQSIDPNFSRFGFEQTERALWIMASQEPAHLLNPAYVDWRELKLAAVDYMIDRMAESGGSIDSYTWGSRNRLAMKHPVGNSLPFLGAFLAMPADPLPGDINMPRVQADDYGASERFVVAPGHEENGIFHMPGGQSGHPLSPFWQAGHDAWVKGEPTPFLPGPAQHSLKLQPTP